MRPEISDDGVGPTLRRKNRCRHWLGGTLLALVMAVGGTLPAVAAVYSISRVSVDQRDIDRSVTVSPGATFRYWATASRSGTRFWTFGSGITIWFLRSDDSTISSTDTRVARDTLTYSEMGGDSPSYSALTYADVVAPTQTGTYYYGACIGDDIATSILRGSNCGSSSDHITVTVVVPQDFSISRVSLDESSVQQSVTVAPSASFRYWARANRTGMRAWTSTSINFKRSSNTLISMLDTTIGTGELTYSNMGGSVSRYWRDWYLDVTAPSQPGVYYYGACIDDIPFESDTSNNCGSAAEYVTVTVSVPLVNLTVGSLLAPLRAYSSSDIQFTRSGVWELDQVSDPWVEATVANAGPRRSGSTTAVLYRSGDQTFNLAEDDAVATAAVPALEALGTHSMTFSDIALPSAPGTYFYAVYVREVSGEIGTEDNWSPASQDIRIVVQRPSDLAAAAITVNGNDHDYAAASTGTLTFSVTATNVGQGRSFPVPGADHLIYHKRPADNEYRPIPSSWGGINSLFPNGQQVFTASLPAPSETGEHRYKYGIAASGLDCKRCDNNLSTAVTLTVVPELPDLAVSQIRVNGVSATELQALPNSSVHVSANVRNVASSAAPVPTTIRLVMTESASGNNVITVGRSAVLGSPLSSGTNAAMSMDVTSKATPGEYPYQICVISEIRDKNQVNNCQAVTIAVVRHLQLRPDIAVEQFRINGSATVTSTIRPGAPINLSATVRNVAATNAPAPNQITVTVTLLDSQGAMRTLASTVVPLGARGVLPGQQSVPVELSVNAPTITGRYRLQLCAVGNIDEDSETSSNNCSTLRTVEIVAAPSAPLQLTAEGSRNRIVLRWELPASNGGSAITRYRIESSQDNANWDTLLLVPAAPDRVYSHRNLGSDEVRYYRIAAINVVGAGHFSNVARAWSAPPYSALLVADVNLDGRVTADDAQLLYYAFELQSTLGDGTRGGQPGLRHTFLQPFVGDLLEPNDEDLRGLLASAHEFSTSAKHASLDVDRSGTVDSVDALIIYFALTYRELLGDGRTGGFETYRRVFLSPLVGGTNDQVRRQLIRRVHLLRDEQYSSE